jgi:hypothetical protein
MRQRRIRIERAVMAVARNKISAVLACRNVGLTDRAAASEVRRVCDMRGFPRRFQWGVLPVCKTHEPSEAFVDSPAQEKAACARRRKLKKCARSKDPAAKMVEVRRP